MPRPEWRVLNEVNFDDLKKTRIQYHQAIQNVAAVGRTFLPESKSDHNAYLNWIPGHSRLAGNWIKGKQQFRSSIGFNEFSIYLVDRQVQIISQLDLAGTTFQQSLLWLEQQVGLLGLESAHLDDVAPYSIPRYEYLTEPFSEPTAEMRLFLGNLFHNAYTVFREFSSFLKITPVAHTRPHQFDHVAEITLKETGTDETNTKCILGMSPGDELFEAPYFYVATQPHVKTRGFGTLGLGIWVEEEWTGSILPIRNLISLKNQRGSLMSFFKSSYEILSKNLLR